MRHKCLSKDEEGSHAPKTSVRRQREGNRSLTGYGLPWYQLEILQKKMYMWPLALHQQALIRTIMLNEALQRYSGSALEANGGMRSLNAQQYQITGFQT